MLNNNGQGGNGYKHTALGWIPEDWNILRGQDISTKITKGSSPNWQGFQYQENGVLFVTSENVRDGFLDVNKPKYLPLGFNEKLKNSILNEGDVLINIVGASIGRSCLYNIETLGNINQAVCLVRLKETINRNYIVNYLQLPKSIDNLINTQSDSARPNLTLEDIRNFFFLLPTLEEQTVIAKLLNTWDTAIQKINALIGQKESRKKWLKQQLLTGKKRLKGFTNEWKQIKFQDLADKNKKWSFTGGPFGSNLKAEDYTDVGVRIIQLQNIGDGTFNDDYKIYTTEKKADELLSCNIYPGEIIISKMGDPVARACFMPEHATRYLMASDGIRLAIDETSFNKKFIHDYINFDVFRRKAVESSTGSTRQRIGLDDLRKLPLLIPSLKEQTAIANVLQTADKEIQLLKTKLGKLKEQKKGLMQVLLTGKKRLKMGT